MAMVLIWGIYGVKIIMGLIYRGVKIKGGEYIKGVNKYIGE